MRLKTHLPSSPPFLFLFFFLSTLLLFAVLPVLSQPCEGSDCPPAFIVTELTFGKPQTGELKRSGWIYYHLSVDSQTPFSIRVRESGEGDCDVYVLNGTFPNKQKYYERDITLDRDVNITISTPHPLGSWYFGIYAFQSCQYSLTAYEEALNPCLGHGKQIDGKCVCTPPYYGSSCAEAAGTLTADTVVSENLESGAWAYYYVRTPKPREVTIKVEQDGDGDTDLYVRYGNIPTIKDYDYRDMTVQKNYSLSFYSKRGYYFFGVYAYPDDNKEFRFKLSYSTSGGCPLECSHHGRCLDDECFCQPAYEGEMCETMIPSMRIGQVVRGHSGEQSWNYYHIDEVNSNSNLELSLTQEEESGDCDLFVRSGVPPTTSEFDYSDTSVKTAYNVTIEYPARNVWYIGVLGFRPCSYSLVARLVTDCPNGCSGHGECKEGHCACEEGFAGPQCGSSIIRIQNGQETSGDIASGEWKYYQVPVSGKITYATLSANRADRVKLFGSFHSAPTLRDYQFHDPKDPLHLLINLPEGINSMIFAVFGSAFEESTTHFQFIVWSSPF